MTATTTTRCAIYARVSTSEQNCELQIVSFGTTTIADDGPSSVSLWIPVCPC